MDYTLFRRELIYKKRTSLEELADEHEEIIFLIDNMLDSYYFSSVDGKDRALRCFNTAYYLCTLILLCENRPEWYFAKYCDIAYCGNKGNKVYQSFTLSLVYIFLTHTFYEVPCKKLLKKLDSFFDQYSNALRLNDPFLNDYTYRDVYEDLLKNSPDDFLISEEFSPRKIDRDIFREVDGPGDVWSKVTNNYDGKEIRKIVDSLGKNEEEKLVLIELIIKDARRFYGSSNEYQITVKSMLDEMDELIYHRYNEATDQVVMESENEKLQYFGDETLLQARIRELEIEVTNLQEQLSRRENTIESDGHNQQLTDSQKTIKEQEATINDLNETIKKYQMRGLPPTKRKGIALGLTPIQADIFGDFLADKLDIAFDNKKEELSLILNCLFGQGRSSLANKMSKVNSHDSAEDRLYVASIFGPSSPEIAKEICPDWDENTLAPWEEDEEVEEKTIE